MSRKFSRLFAVSCFKTRSMRCRVGNTSKLLFRFHTLATLNLNDVYVQNAKEHTENSYCLNLNVLFIIVYTEKVKCKDLGTGLSSYVTWWIDCKNILFYISRTFMVVIFWSNAVTQTFILNDPNVAKIIYRSFTLLFLMLLFVIIACWTLTVFRLLF